MIFSPWAPIGWSAWPFISGCGMFMFPTGMVLIVFYGSKTLALVFFIILLFAAISWFGDLSVEGELGFHSSPLVATLIGGVCLFIASEAALFFSLFWSAGHSGVIPSILTGSVLPGSATLISPFSLPVFNLITLLWSSATVNLSHGYLRIGIKSYSLIYSGFTIFLGALFMYAQYVEYSSAILTISDGAFLSSFYLTTGVHGSHVFAGLVVLSVNFCRLFILKPSPGSNLSWASGLWYWHFVDLIWVIVWSLLYLWPAL